MYAPARLSALLWAFDSRARCMAMYMSVLNICCQFSCLTSDFYEIDNDLIKGPLYEVLKILPLYLW